MTPADRARAVVGLAWFRLGQLRAQPFEERTLQGKRLDLREIEALARRLDFCVHAKHSERAAELIDLLVVDRGAVPSEDQVPWIEAVRFAANEVEAPFVEVVGVLDAVEWSYTLTPTLPDGPEWCLDHGYHIETAGSVTDHRYILVRLDDAREVAEVLKTQHAVSAFRAALSQRFGKSLPPRVQLFVERVEDETGGDLQDIVRQLKTAEPCHACVVEAQLRSCVCWRSNRLGRRLARLIERADNPQGEKASEIPK